MRACRGFYFYWERRWRARTTEEGEDDGVQEEEGRMPTAAVSDKAWMGRREELMVWRARAGHCRVPKAEGELGRYVLQRGRRRRPRVGCAEGGVR